MIPLLLSVQKHFTNLIFLLPCIALADGPVMISPEIDRQSAEVFSYFSQPTDQLSVVNATTATEITPEGYLYTGFGELMFFAGANKIPISQRIRVFENGYLPVINYHYELNGINYQFQIFTAGLNQDETKLVNFIKVTITNTHKKNTRADFAIGMRYQKNINADSGVSDNRFRRPETPKYLGDYQQIGETYQKDWIYRFDATGFYRENKLLFTFPIGYQTRSFTLQDNGYLATQDITPRQLNILPTTPVGIVTYTKMLHPKESYSLHFKMPVIPFDKNDDQQALLKINFKDSHQNLTQQWQSILDEGMQIELPEKKAVDTFKVSLINDLMARDKIENHIIQYVNKLQYHQFFLRDAADIAYMYDLTGYPKYAKETLDFFLKWQKPDGSFISQPQEFDAFGQVLWAYGQHYRYTGDKKFAQQIFPHVIKAVHWLKRTRLSDPLHLLPAANLTDNEHIAGHITGHNFLALAGLKNAIYLANGLDKHHEATWIKSEYKSYRDIFLQRLKNMTDANQKIIPPALDNEGGYDWGNLLGAYPETILSPHDPRITATLKAASNKYQEGLMTYGNGRWLHHYLTIKNAFTHLIRGEQEQVIKIFYSLLLHTSATHGGFEFSIRPWGDRNFYANLSPHGWFAAEYRTLLRKMLVREEDQTVHLLSAISPAWIGKNKVIAVEKVPTPFGVINLTLRQRDDESAEILIDSHWQTPPKQLLLHLPWFMQMVEITVDGKPTVITKSVILSPFAQKIQVRWFKKLQLPQLSYKGTVEEYKAEYKKRYSLFMHGNS